MHQLKRYPNCLLVIALGCVNNFCTISPKLVYVSAKRSILSPRSPQRSLVLLPIGMPIYKLTAFRTYILSFVSGRTLSLLLLS
jgi:hypothetical protein